MMELREIASDVYACLQEDRGLGTSNSGLVNRAGGLVVDTFWDLPHTRQMIETYARVWRGPVRRVVNTHHNGDHCWGNQLFTGAEILGHRLCAASFGKERPELMQMLRNGGGSEDPMLRDMARQLAAWDFTGITLTPPTTLVEFTGDVLFRLCTPVGWEGTYARWIAALDEIVALDPAVVVPGHGPLSGVEGPREMQAYLRYVRAEAKRGFDAGLPTLEAARRIDLGPYAGWTEPERILFQVERAYRELRGEPYDVPIDVTALFRGMHALRESRRAVA